MCIICVKEKNASLPSNKLLKRMAHSNPDLCGVSFQYKRGIVTYRGIDVRDIIKIKAEIPVESVAVFHFRIATSGIVNTLNSHPFPLWGDKESTMVSGKYSLSHNGIYFGGSDLKSDTLMVVELFEDTKPLGSALKWLEILNASTNSKTAILSRQACVKFGSFVTVPEYQGLSFSNTYWKYQGETWKNYTKYQANDYSTCASCGIAPLVGEERKNGLCRTCYKTDETNCTWCKAELTYWELKDGLGICDACRYYDDYGRHSYDSNTTASGKVGITHNTQTGTNGKDKAIVPFTDKTDS